MSEPQTMRRPAEGDYAPYYAGYVALVPPGDLIDLLRAQQEKFRRLPAAVGGGREAYAYAPGKWTIRQLAGHLADAERVFGHRAFCFSRGEQAPLPGFDENAYVERGGAHGRALADLADELAVLRQGNIELFGALDDGAWDNVGIANDAPVSVRALAWIVVGHAEHHLKILRERYGVEL